MNFKRCILIIPLLMIFSYLLKSQSLEYTLKASLIEKFCRFTEWENNSVGEYFEINVLGESPFNGEFEKLAKTLKIKNRPLKINYIKNYLEAKYCHVLFICSSEENNVQEIINHLGNRNILLVGDTPGFSEAGIHFNFYIKENGTMHFEINPRAFRKARLKVDMQLLNIGKIIDKASL